MGQAVYRPKKRSSTALVITNWRNKSTIYVFTSAVRQRLTYVGVLEVLEERDLAYGSARRTLLVLKPYLLQCHQVVSQP